MAFDYNRIFYTDEQCQALSEEYKRLEKEANPIESIANGENALPREFPFAVSINTIDSNGINEHKCGGSIITKR